MAENRWGVLHMEIHFPLSEVELAEDMLEDAETAAYANFNDNTEIKVQTYAVTKGIWSD